MESNGIAAKRRKKLRSYCFYAPFASLRGYSLFQFCSLCYGLTSGSPVFVPAQRPAAPGAGAAQLPLDRLSGGLAGSSSAPFASLCQTPPTSPTCILRHVTPKTLQKALLVGLFGSDRLLQVVYFGWSQFPFPEAPLAG